MATQARTPAPKSHLALRNRSESWFSQNVPISRVSAPSACSRLRAREICMGRRCECLRQRLGVALPLVGCCAIALAALITQCIAFGGMRPCVFPSHFSAGRPYTQCVATPPGSSRWCCLRWGPREQSR